MELKRNINFLFYLLILWLLIVPYGIETKKLVVTDITLALLIVPYGIETDFYHGIVSNINVLLIVPYGIETAMWAPGWLALGLLIVPYGIETNKHVLHLCGNPMPFNRTLWN